MSKSPTYTYITPPPAATDISLQKIAD